MRKTVIFFMLINLGLMAEKSEMKEDNYHIELKVPIYEAPYNYESKNKFFLESPSMNQALDLSKSFDLSVIYMTNKYLESKYKEGKLKKLKTTLSYAGLYLLTFQLPLGDVWLHEEYHRAVMNKNGIDSHNGVYNFKMFSSSTPVDQVKDSDLIKLKKEAPQDMIRLHSAGYEGQNELTLELEKELFFNDIEEYRAGIYLYAFMNIMTNHQYLYYTTTKEGDEETDKMKNEEGLDISVRDFTGYDFTAWVYDLFRPNEPYEDRGVHPSGVGIDRYIKYSDLTEEEQKYLYKQSKLSWLSFLDFDLLWIDDIKFGNNKKLSLNLKHYLTPFGNSINANVLYKSEKINLFTSILKYSNYNNDFFGLDMQLINYPVDVFDKNVLLNGRASIWEQPENLEFRSSKGKLGGLLGLELKYPVNNKLSLDFGLEGKTKGWVASNVYLEENIITSLGFSFFID